MMCSVCLVCLGFGVVCGVVQIQEFGRVTFQASLFFPFVLLRKKQVYVWSGSGSSKRSRFEIFLFSWQRQVGGL